MRSTSRTFTDVDQRSFARLSGDHNPVHLDPIVARRTLFGGTVVHGMHQVLWALAALGREGLALGRLAELRAQFRKPLRPGTPVALELPGAAREAVRLRAVAASSVTLTLTARFEGAPLPAWTVPEGCPPAGTPRELDLARLWDASGEAHLLLDERLGRELLPGVDRCLDSLQLAQLLAITRVVGMSCPGLDSVFGQFRVCFSPRGAGEGGALVWRVAECDPRFSRVDLELASTGMEGTLTAFLRPRPRQQRSAAELVRVEPGEFEEQRALVVGGSRGLGEVASKLLGAGGGEVRLTYHRGREDAERTVADIAASGGRAQALRFDVLDSSGVAPLLRGSWRPTHLYYFASPFVFEGAGRGFQPALLARFCDHYVSGFAHLVGVLMLGDPGGGLRVLFPSSSALEERPVDMAEYVAAKAAGEALCGVLQRRHPKLRIWTPRLPRLATDQTSSLLGLEGGDPIPVMLDLLRRIGA